MVYCYPAIILVILTIVMSIIFGRDSTGECDIWWRAVLLFGSIPLFFSIISFILCRKGYTSMSWIMLFGPFVVFSMIMNGVIRITFLESSTVYDNGFVEQT